MSNRILFRRSNLIFVQNYDEDSKINFSEVASFDQNLRRLGYTINSALAERLLHAPVDEIARIHKDVIAEAKEIKGVRNYRAMYPNFPTQVMEASAAELHINAILHYFGDMVGLRITPEYDKKARPELDFDNFIVVGLADSNSFDALILDMFKANSSFSDTDKADISSLGMADFDLALTRVRNADNDIPNRENKAFIAAIAHRFGFILPYMDTATDVLRFAAALSDGDVSLASKTVFRSFKRSERRIMMDILAGIGERSEYHLNDDMVRHQTAWKRLGERLHPGEFGEKYVNVKNAFDIVRGNNKFVSYNSTLETAIAAGNAAQVAELLSERPGEFARRLDKVVRMAKSDEISTVINKFADVASSVSLTVLFQVRNAMINRDKPSRVFFPKGSVSKMKSVVDTRPEISLRTRDIIVNIIDNAIAQQVGSRGDLGKTWVDPDLAKVAIPFGLRNASKSIQTFGRGTRISLGEDTNIVRFFIWWKDAGFRTDIDLSAGFYDKNFDNSGSPVSYMSLRRSGAVHSGDITSAPNGASEFIDIDVDRLLSQGVRYVVMTLHSYSGQPLIELPECFAGFMERKNMNSGEIYDPRTVVNKADLTSNTNSATPFIFDLVSREAVWVDLSVQANGAGHNILSTGNQITSIVEAMVGLTPPNLYDLFLAHAQERGVLVGNREDADLVFSFDGDVTPFDTEKILSEYL